MDKRKIDRLVDLAEQVGLRDYPFIDIAAVERASGRLFLSIVGS